MALLPAAAHAQRLEIRGAARVLDFALDSSLGINPDSLRLRGRGVHYVDVQQGTGDTVGVGDSSDSSKYVEKAGSRRSDAHQQLDLPATPSALATYSRCTMSGC